MHEESLTLKFNKQYWIASFSAMASPCYVYIDHNDVEKVKNAAVVVANEAYRIERKFSRYRDDNVIYQINNSQGMPVKVDAETSLLLNYAEQCYQLSEGAFDITSGVLRRAWTFDGSDNLPRKSDVTQLLEKVGWEKIQWQSPQLTLQDGMELDFGGIGKEYAVDRAATLLKEAGIQSAIVNFGGDLVCIGERQAGYPWEVAIEPTSSSEKVKLIKIRSSALATSGTTKRYVKKNGVRYGHIIDPRSGYPVEHAPLSVTVEAATCLEAGILATMAMLHGEHAEAFLKLQGVRYWM
ncbi:MAG: FAD:protein FMN transferase [Gammaproteobacteria bacterium]|nr:FAD:protein FMN transferase [Gammaproteobacteria bacterium]